MRFSTNIQNNNEIFTDLNGFQVLYQIFCTKFSEHNPFDCIDWMFFFRILF